MKYLLILCCLLYTSVGCSKEVSMEDLIERDGLYYEKFKDISFSGEAVVYYKNSKLSEKFNYKNGKLDGIYIRYYENGQLEINRNYKDGKLDGTCNMYYNNGQLYKKSNWKNEGSQ